MAHGICNFKCNVSNEIPAIFHNGWNYDYHFITKELANELEGLLKCIGKNREIYKSFSVRIKKILIKIDKDGKESVETISYKIKSTNSMTFMANFEIKSC